MQMACETSLASPVSLLSLFLPVISVTFFCVPTVHERMWELEGKKVCVPALYSVACYSFPVRGLDATDKTCVFALSITG